ncbi:MAG TPA: DUF6049 family protein [Streptosporangiaceae bacterium]
MRSLFRVAASAVLTALVAVPAIQAGPASASARASQAGTSPVTLAIDSITPQVATAASTIVVSGTVTNNTGSSLAGLSVELDSTQSQFTARELMDDFSGGSYTPGLTQDGNPLIFTVTVPRGGTASWKIEFTAADAGMTEFGVYGLDAELVSSSGGILTTDRELLPFWPGSSAGVAKLKVAWIWPLVDQPYNQACGWLTSDNLESSLAPDGRLNGLLTAGTSDPRAQLTWAVDPALLADAQTLGSRHQVGAADCTGQSTQPGSAAARDWLTKLQAATTSQSVIVTPYANVDIAALVHHGLTGDLKSAYQLAQEVADPILNKAFVRNIGLPAAGIADQSVLTALAALPEQMPSVVLNSTEMPLASGEFADDAIASWASGAGTPMSVLLADNTLTDVLKGAGTTSRAGQFAIEQRYLAETAMIAAEAPNDPRSLVVSPPETWDPSQALAAGLLRETTSAPWLQPVQLESLTGQRTSQDEVKRKPLAADKVNARELSRAYLNKVSGLDAQLGVYSSMLYRPPAGYEQQLAQALAATESSAWRGGGSSAAQGEALADGLDQYLYNSERRVKILPPGQISMAGASGDLPVTIENQLEKQAIQVKLTATVQTAAGVASTMTIASQKLIIIQPGQVRLVKLSVHSAPHGPSTIDLSLTTANGTVLPWTTGTSLAVNSTRYGQAILLLIAAAIGLLLLSSAFRSGRRRLAASGGRAGGPAGGPVADSGRDPDNSSPHAGGKEHGSPGNVMRSAQDPTEAPDDLADARRWADDT